MAMKVVNATTEKVLNTNLNTYLKRAEEKIRNRSHNEALDIANRLIN